MKIAEIINEKREQLKEFAIENNTGYTNEVVEQVLDVKAANQWSNGMTLEEMLKREGLQ
jgi:hypothetical protein